MWNKSFLPCATLAVGLGLLNGCCNCLKPPAADPRPLPSPISLNDQLQALNARASALPRLIATAESGGVEVLYVEDGKPHHESGDGKLFLQQNYAEHSANVYLVAKALGQPVFELGKNETVQWMIPFWQKSGATVSAVRPRSTLLNLNNGPAGILQAGLIPAVLAITEIVPASDETIVMRVDDLRGVNDLLIEHLNGDGTAIAEREIIVDRRSGDVQEVDLFGGDGSLLVHATLDHYVMVTLPDGKPPQQAAIPSMPRHIVIDQPATHFRLGLTLASISMPAQIKPIVFETPDWSDQGITPTQIP